MLAMERPGTFGAAGTSAGSPPSNLSNNVALSFTLIVLLSNDAVNVEANAAEANWLTAIRASNATNHEAFHEPERRTPVRHGVLCPPSRHRAEQEFGAPFARFSVPMHAQKRKRALH